MSKTRSSLPDSIVLEPYLPRFKLSCYPLRAGPGHPGDYFMTWSIPRVLKVSCLYKPGVSRHGRLGIRDRWNCLVATASVGFWGLAGGHLEPSRLFGLFRDVGRPKIAPDVRYGPSEGWWPGGSRKNLPVGTK